MTGQIATVGVVWPGRIVGTGWLNLLLRDKLPTGNEQGSAGMATVGSGAYTYEPVENWTPARLVIQAASF